MESLSLSHLDSHSMCSGPGENSTIYRSLVQSIFPVSVCYNNKNIVDKKKKTENPDGQRRLAGCSPRGCKELDMTEATEHACMHFISLKDAEAET